ncbi:hypothetical protein PO909_009494 [Leuciscus waleckii]
MDGNMGEMSVHSHVELAHSQDSRAMLHSRDLAAAFPRPSLGGPAMGLESDHQSSAYDHSMATLGYGRDAPTSCGSTYTTLTPLQPFDDKFHHHHHHHPCLPVSNVIGSFTLMREDRGLGGNYYTSYGKDFGLGQGLSPPLGSAGLETAMHGYGSLGSQNGHSSQMLPGGHEVHMGSNGGNICRTAADFVREISQNGGGGEEINTKDVAQRIITELKRYSIPQAIFAERVLCRSQGTLSDLLRNPKPWGKLKSGRETFKRMSRWLQEPEFQRMASLRLEGKRACSNKCLKLSSRSGRVLFKTMTIGTYMINIHKQRMGRFSKCRLACCSSH